MATENQVKIRLEALKNYVDRIGGTIIIEGDSIDVFIPIAVEEVAGGIQYHIKGKVVGSDMVLEECTIHVEAGKVASVNVKDLVPWLKYISEYFSG